MGMEMEESFYFTYIRKILVENGIASVYPSFMREIDFYEDYFKTHALLSETPDYKGQKFQAVLQWKGRDLFSLEWDILQMLRDLKNYSLPVTIFPVPCDDIYSDKNALIGSQVDYYRIISNIEEIDPILLVWIDFTERFHIIDGNHRYRAAQLNNQKAIKAVIIPPGIHLKYMLSEESRMRYKVIHNLLMMSNILLYPRCTVSEKMDDSRSIYPISNQKIALGFLRFLRLLSRRMLRIPRVITNFEHEEKGRNFDQKM